MKKIIVFGFFLIFICYQSHSQGIDTKSDTAIYQCLIKALGVGNPNINDTIAIFYKTSLHSIKISDFKNKRLSNSWKPVDKQLGKDELERLQIFVNQIDINSLNEPELTAKLGKHPLKKTEYKTYRDMVMDDEFYLTLSPVIYSANKQMALCSVGQSFGFNNGSEAIYLLMFRNGKWQLVRALGLGFS